jgi:hypothetical protein
MITTGLGIVRPPASRQLEEEQGDESSTVSLLDDPMTRVVAPLSEYLPLFDEVKSKTSDQICMELAAECDRLRVLIDDSYYAVKSKPGETASIVARRLSALRSLAQRLDEVKGKEEVEIELSTISSVVSMVRDVLRETGVSHETREIVFQKLLSRITAKRERAIG